MERGRVRARLRRMRPLLAGAVSAALLAACGQQAPSQPDPGAAEEIGEAQDLPRAPLPQADGAPRYVGLWAANEAMCAEPAWAFNADSLTTLGEVSCDFDAVTEIANDYVIDATCTAEAPPAPYQFQLTFAESAQAMLVAGGPWDGPIRLVYCGPESAEPR